MGEKETRRWSQKERIGRETKEKKWFLMLQAMEETIKAFPKSKRTCCRKYHKTLKQYLFITLLSNGF